MKNVECGMKNEEGGETAHRDLHAVAFSEIERDASGGREARGE
jgi:hypothetical protein